MIEGRAIRPLDEVLAYQNDEVVYRFSSDHAVSVDDAAEIFVETKRWLWLCAGSKERIPLLSEAQALDMMWHTFLLFTDDYAKFCERYFGTFIHHHPRTRADKQAWLRRIEEDADAALKERREGLRKAYAMVYDQLGPATLKKWCEEFPTRFTFESSK